MRVKHLVRGCIRDNGWEEYTLSVTNPSWLQIEDAIRQLDRYHFVSVCLITEEGREGRPKSKLDVFGGRGKYAMECFMTGDLDRYFCDESKPNGEQQVRIWESNQGAYLEEKYLCDDIKIVLPIVRYFTERGRPDPRVYWEQ